MAKNDEKNLKKITSIEEEISGDSIEESEVEQIDSEDNDSEISSNSDQSEFNENETQIPNNGDGFQDAIRSELNSMTFEQIQQLQNKLGLKKFKEVMQEKSTPGEVKNFKRLNKNRPQELTSKKPVSTFRNIFQVDKKERIDPRFNQAIGIYKPEVFRKRYGFVNDMRLNEKQMLVAELKNEQDPEKRELIKSALNRLKHQINSFKESEKNEEFSSKLKKQANEDAKEGKKPHFVNKSDQKIIKLAEKYQELKKSGKIEQFLAKKRKKQLSKEKKNFGSKHLRFV